MTKVMKLLYTPCTCKCNGQYILFTFCASYGTNDNYSNADRLKDYVVSRFHGVAVTLFR